jgi:GH15 family glucan-1,4-alpha-glucosidase
MSGALRYTSCMSRPIEDYALLGDCQTAALVGNDGSIDWLCFPRFDSPACFAKLLGEREHGRWKIAPVGEPTRVTRRYRDGTMILETEIETADGVVVIIDFMPLRTRAPDIVRIVVGKRGTVRMNMDLVVRFDYGSTVPWVRKVDGALLAVAGPNAVRLVAPVSHRGEGMATVADFDMREGERVPFILTWYPSFAHEPGAIDPERALVETESFWKKWSDRSTYQGEHKEAVTRSLITLKALTDARTGGIVAAPTTSLPEALGGVRNWDYRYCWLRDATFTLLSLLSAGYREEAQSWREWLLRAVAGEPSKLQIMYTVNGDRRLEEYEVPWLPGYEKSAPVRIGNAAFAQRQLDVYGEVIDALHQSHCRGLDTEEFAWRMQVVILDFLETAWKEPDEGIWEVRGPRRDFTHSKVMAWVAFDRAVKSVERFKVEGPLDKWRTIRDAIHREVCDKGYDSKKNTFVQHYGATDLDASVLMLPLVGFLPASDPRVRGTVEAIMRELDDEGFVRRYLPQKSGVDGLPGAEGVFLPCTFWLADNLYLLGRHDEARAIFARLLALRNDVGLLSEEYDVRKRRLVGNFPQAFSHVSLVNSACNLSKEEGPADQRTKT